MKTTNWSCTDVSRFWQLADELQDQTIDHAKGLFSFAENASPKELMALLVQYRFFTIYYIPDIALLIARMQGGKLRSFLADILSDELGYGDPLKAHPRLYDDFLKSIGAADEDLDTLAIKDNLDLLDNVRRKLLEPGKSTAYGIGLRGMGGECVCQIYLSRFYEHIVKNPYIQARKSSIDWRFWDLHIGEHDIDHRVRTRQLINDEIVAHGASEVAELGQGYCESMTSWASFWENIFESVKSQHVNRVRVSHTVNLQMPIDSNRSSTTDAAQSELGALA